MVSDEKEMRKREEGRARREKQPKTGRGIDRRAKWMDTKKDEERDGEQLPGQMREGWRERCCETGMKTQGEASAATGQVGSAR